MLVCLVVDLGGAPDHDRRGFRYWRDAPFNDDYLNIMPLSKARFLGCKRLLLIHVAHIDSFI